MEKFAWILLSMLVLNGCGQGGDDERQKDLERIYHETEELFEKGKYREAKEKMTSIYSDFERLPVKDHATRIRYLRFLCDISLQMEENYNAIEYATELISHAITDDDRGFAYNVLGVVSVYKGEYDKAIEYHRKSLAIDLKTFGPEHLTVAKRYNNIGESYRHKGEYDKAIEYYRKSMMIDLKVLDPDHPEVAIPYNNIGLAYSSKGEYDNAIGYYEKAMAIQLKSLGHEHPAVATSYNNLGAAYANKGFHRAKTKALFLKAYERAIWYHEKAMAIYLKTLGPMHPDVAMSYNNLGLAYGQTGDKAKAMSYLLKAKAILVKRLGPQHSDTRNVQSAIDSLK